MKVLDRLWPWRWRWCLSIGRCLPTVVLVRHADVPTGAGSDPSLTAAGQTRAQELVHVLGDAGIDLILVTSWARTQQTAAPLAAALSLTPVVVGTVDDALAALRARPSSSVALVVGHTNTVPGVVEGLGGPVGLTIASTQFDRMFVVVLGRLTRLRYGA